MSMFIVNIYIKNKKIGHLLLTSYISVSSKPLKTQSKVWKKPKYNS